MAFGRFPRAAHAKPFSDINVTPLVDVMLVLLVIFILTAPLLTSAIRLDLPQSKAAQAGEAPEALSLSLKAIQSRASGGSARGAQPQPESIWRTFHQ